MCTIPIHDNYHHICSTIKLPGLNFIFADKRIYMATWQSMSQLQYQFFLYLPIPSACSNIAIGIPTFFDLPQTTACFPNVSTPKKSKTNTWLTGSCEIINKNLSRYTYCLTPDYRQFWEGNKGQPEWEEKGENIYPHCGVLKQFTLSTFLSQSGTCTNWNVGLMQKVLQSSCH